MLEGKRREQYTPNYDRLRLIGIKWEYIRADYTRTGIDTDAISMSFSNTADLTLNADAVTIIQFEVGNKCNRLKFNNLNGKMHQ